MTESLKFGPEWLRTCSSTSTNCAPTTSAASSAPRYPLSEFRYGREEMLALFDKNIKHPEILPRYKNLFVEKIQCPLALNPSAEDDQVTARMWPMRSSPGLSVRGGRGGLMDRGRGRGRGAYHSVSGGFSRSSAFPDEEGGRILGGRGERWLDRNGTDPGEWASGLQSTSPRKEYNSHGRGTGLESWRRPRTDEDTPAEQWRSGSLGPREPPKWGRSVSWREEESSLGESRGYNNERGYSGVGPERPMAGRPMPRRPWDVPEDNLPEWAVENPLESGGSFDATGAFHGSDDELSPSDGMGRLDKHNFKARGNRGLFKGELNGADGSSGRGGALHDDDEQRPRRSRNESDQELDATENGKAATLTDSSEAVEAPTSSPRNSVQQSVGNESEAESALSKSGEAPNVDRMQEVADDMVEKLIMDDEKEKPGKMMDDGKMNSMGASSTALGPKGGVVNDTDWFYRDPQDMVQGPFSAMEMAEWYQAGYFDNNLCVRRKNDQRFSKLGDLIDMCGGEMPFFVPYRPLPMPEVPSMKVPPILPHRMNPAQAVAAAAAMLEMDPNIDPRLLRQNFIARQQAIAYQKLSSSDMWHMLSPEQQRQMIAKHIAQIPVPDSIYGLQAAMAANEGAPFGMFEGLMNKPPPPLDGSGTGADSAAMLQQNLMAKKMQQAAAAAHHQRILPPGQQQGQQVPGHMPMMPPLPQDFPAVLNPADPLNQLMHNMRIFPQGGTGGNVVQGSNGMNSMMGPGPQQPENDRIKSLLMQLSMQKGMQPQGGPGAPTLSQMAMSQQQQQQFQHLQKGPGMMPWPFDAADPLKGGPAPPGPMGLMGTQGGNGGAASNWMAGLDGSGVNVPQPSGPTAGGDRHAGAASGGGIWELEHKLFSGGVPKPIEMKTEKQIIEEQQLAAAILQKELESQQQQQHQQQPNQKLNQQHLQEMSVPEQMQEMRGNEVAAANDNKGWTKVEAKGNNNIGGGTTGQQKDKRNSEQNAKKKDAVSASAKVGVQKKEEPKKTATPSKDTSAASGTMVQKGKVENKMQNSNKGQSEKGTNNGSAKSLAPWTIVQPQEAPGLSLAEIQKLELEQQRAEQARMDTMLQQQQQQQWFDIQNLKAELPKWNAPQLAPSVVKSLAEIQAEEQAKLRQWQESQAAAGASGGNQQPQQPTVAAIAAAAAAKRAAEEAQAAAAGPVWGGMKAWNGQQSAGAGAPSSSLGGFWEDPVKSVSNTATSANRVAAGGKTIAKSQTMSNIQPKPAQQPAVKTNVPAKGGKQGGAAAAAGSGSASTNGLASKKEPKSGRGKKDDGSGQEFTQWCTKALSAYNSTIDIPTFVSFLQDIESPYEVKDYIRVYLGETKECVDFCKQFLERRSKYKNQIRAANAHVDDMCSPAPAITPSSDFQEVKGKAKKVKKNKMMKLDSRILGFSVTAAQDRINVGDRDYPNAS